MIIFLSVIALAFFTGVEAYLLCVFQTTEQEMHECEHDVEHCDAAGAVNSDGVLPKQQSHIDNKLFKDYYIVSSTMFHLIKQEIS